MKLIIAGSREFKEYDLLCRVVQEFKDITEVVSGHAIGADKLGERWAKENNIELKLFPAQWDKYGKSAGYRRNVEMAAYGDTLLSFWNGRSLGSHHMIKAMRRIHKPVMIVNYENW